MTEFVIFLWKLGVISSAPLLPLLFISRSQFFLINTLYYGLTSTAWFLPIILVYRVIAILLRKEPGQRRGKIDSIGIENILRDNPISIHSINSKEVQQLIYNLKKMLHMFNVDTKVGSCVASSVGIRIRVSTGSESQCIRLRTLGREIAKCLRCDSVRIHSANSLTCIEAVKRNRPNLTIKELITKTRSHNWILPVGIDIVGNLVAINLKHAIAVSLIGDCQDSKTELIEAFILNILILDRDTDIYVFDLTNRYHNYGELIHLVRDNFGQYIAKLSNTSKPSAVFIDIIDTDYEIFTPLFQSENINLKKILNVYNLMSAEMLYKCIPHKIVFKMSKQRNLIANKYSGIEDLLDKYDAMYYSVDRVERVQTPAISNRETVKILEHLSSRKKL